MNEYKILFFINKKNSVGGYEILLSRLTILDISIMINNYRIKYFCGFVGWVTLSLTQPTRLYNEGYATPCGRIEMKKWVIQAWLLVISGCGISIAQDMTLTGPDVVHFKYPANFKENARYIRQGRETDDGMCEFVGTLRAKAGESVVQHEIAYDRTRCLSLVVQGIRVDRDKH